MSREKQIEEMVYDLMACHTEFYENAELYTDYYDMARNLIAKGYRKQSEGEWKPRTDVVGFVQCSVCNDCNIYDEWADGKKWNFCPNCGAKMKEGAE